MLFNSYSFFIFLLILLPIYFNQDTRQQNKLLLVFSYIFYAWWDVRFLLLIIASTYIDYICGILIYEENIEKKLLRNPTYFLISSGILLSIINWPEITLEKFFKFSNPIPNNIFIFNKSNLIGLFCLLLIPSIIYLLDKMTINRNLQIRKKIFLLTSLLANLSLLGFFKYYNFFIENFNLIFEKLSINMDLTTLNIILPVGISFYTFQTLSYSIDIYKGRLSPTKNFLNFALFVSYFPQLVAGPIERASELLPRLESKRIISRSEVLRGVHLVIFGMFKKVAIADAIGVFVNQVFEKQEGLLSGDVILGALCFGIQVYCDFSGYTDIARGISKILGIDIVKNFNLPYFSKNLGDFWRRWHISLYSWFTDYIYNPVLIKYRALGKWGGTIAITTTFTLSGLWHGAAWNYILWGALHSLGLTFLLVSKNVRKKVKNLISKKLYELMSFITTQTFVFAVYIVFRATNMIQIKNFFISILTSSPFTKSIPFIPLKSFFYAFPVLIIYELVENKHSNPKFYLNYPKTFQFLFYCVLFGILFIGKENQAIEFVYFQF